MAQVILLRDSLSEELLNISSLELLGTVRDHRGQGRVRSEDCGAGLHLSRLFEDQRQSRTLYLIPRTV